LIWNIDLTKKIEKPKFTICKPDGKPLRRINDIISANLSIKLKGVNELSISIPYSITRRKELVRNPIVDLIKYKYLIKLSYKNIEGFFTVQPPKKNSSEEETMELVCLSREDDLRKRPIENYKRDIGKLHDIAVDFVVETSWTINRIPTQFTGFDAIQMSYEIAKGTVLESLNDLAESFKVIVQFDTINKQVNFYTEDEIGQDNGLVISNKNYLQSLLSENDTGEFCTRLYVYGKDGISINRYNLTGESYIEDFSYFLYPFQRDESGNTLESSDYMSDELCHAILDFQELLISKRGEFDTLLDNEKTKMEQIDTVGNELFQLQVELAQLEDSIEADKMYGTDTTALEQQRDAKQLEVDNKQAEYDQLETELDGIHTSIQNLRSLLSKPNNFSPELLSELDDYIVSDEFNDSNYAEDKVLYAASLDEMEKRKIPPLHAESSISNFFNMVTEQRHWDKLSIGDIVRFKQKNMGINIKAKVIEYSLDFYGEDISIILSNVLSVDDPQRRLIKQLYKGEKASQILDQNKANWTRTGEDLQEYVNTQIEEVNESISNLNLDLNKAVADGYISKTEANVLKVNLNQIMSESYDLLDVGTQYGVDVEVTDYENALIALSTKLSNYIDQPSYPISVLIADRNEISALFEDVQNKKAILLNAINDKSNADLKDELIEYTDGQIDEVNLAQDNLDERLEKYFSDLVLTQIESFSLDVSFRQLDREATDLLDIADILLITTERNNYANALNSLQTELEANWVRKLEYPIDITAEQRANIQTLFANVQDTKSILINKITEVQSQAGKDADLETRATIRNPNPVNNPIILTDGSSIDHVENTDGSVDISFEWTFTENVLSPINGFGVLIYSSDDNSIHVPSLVTDATYKVDKNSRSFQLKGVAADKFYTFGVFAYRNVDTTINPEGIIKSEIVQSSLSTENPFQPSENVAYKGDLIGTIGGQPFDSVNKKAETVIIGTVFGSGDPTQRNKQADIVINDYDAEVIINQVLQDLGQRGGTVRLLEGTYYLYRPILVPSNVTIQGSGKATILFQRRNPNTSPIVLPGLTHGVFENSDSVNGNHNLSIKDLSVEMQAGLFEDESMRTIHFDNVQESSVSGLYIYNCATNTISLLNSHRNRISDNYVDTAQGFVRLYDSDDNIISGNIANNSYGLNLPNNGSIWLDFESDNNSILNNKLTNVISGIICGGEQTIISNNSINNAEFYGIGLYYDKSINIKNNTITSSGDLGIYIRSGNVKVSTISDNAVINSFRNGIQLNSGNLIVKNNTIEGSSQESSGMYAAIHVNADNCKITSNTVLKGKNDLGEDVLSKYAIDLRSGANDNIVQYNNLRQSYLSGGISDSGMNNTVTPNNV
jgi:phage minor structural protein